MPDWPAAEVAHRPTRPTARVRQERAWAKGGAVYLRDDRGAATPSIVGYWINDNGWTSVRFESDGSFQLDDQANAVTTVGTYTLDGNRLVLSSRTGPTGIYLIQLDDGMSFADVNGVPVAHYTRAG